MLEKIKSLLKVQNNESDDIISIYMETNIRKIKNYLNRDDLPPELELIVVEMTVRENGIEIKNFINGENDKEVVSIKRGDMQINYADREELYNKLTGAGGADFIKNYRLQLDPFRKMKVPKPK